LDQLESKYKTLREKIVQEIEEAHEQLDKLQKANDQINIKAEAKMERLDTMISTEIE
jgi:hypothetical protein